MLFSLIEIFQNSKLTLITEKERNIRLGQNYYVFPFPSLVATGNHFLLE
jgi:hypothetical protein